MAYYDGDNVVESKSILDYEKLGNQPLEKLGTLPFWAIRLNDGILLRENAD